MLNLSSDKVLAVTAPMRYWPQKKPRQFKFGSFLGRIVVTDRNFLFLSTGGPGWDESIVRLMVGGLAGLLANVAHAGYTAQALDLSALSNEGSFTVPLERIVACEARRPFLLAFLSMEYTVEQGESRACAIVREAAVGLKDLQVLAQTIKEASKG